ncbi:MAG: isoprenylcysteine carboxylmethyltransferase family protein [Lentisphaerae bacterium]|nr:isoprenylcysteine carboxylmethyltransferase family protein [Lentisphaerota bacterium]
MNIDQICSVSAHCGIGPRIGIAGTAGLLLALVPSWLWPERCAMPLPAALSRVLGLLLLVLGSGLYAWSLVLLRRAWSQNHLATTGPFATMRHPVYAAWIWGFFPAIALLAHSWPYLLALALALWAFARHRDREERDTRQRFGATYDDYARAVPGRILPRRHHPPPQPRKQEINREFPTKN